VDNIVVDISFNQIGGLITLNFLEEINSLIGNSNIFKRSIILVRTSPPATDLQHACWVSRTFQLLAMSFADKTYRHILLMH
jgi:hypothetical protein